MNSYVAHFDCNLSSFQRRTWLAFLVKLIAWKAVRVTGVYFSVSEVELVLVFMSDT